MKYVAGSICPDSFMYRVPVGAYNAGARVACESCGQTVTVTGTGRYRKHLLRDDLEV